MTLFFCLTTPLGTYNKVKEVYLNIDIPLLSTGLDPSLKEKEDFSITFINKKKKSSGEGCLKKGLNGVCLKEDLPSKIFLM